jgi:hypothetical protein
MVNCEEDFVNNTKTQEYLEEAEGRIKKIRRLG